MGGGSAHSLTWTGSIGVRGANGAIGDGPLGNTLSIGGRRAMAKSDPKGSGRQFEGRERRGRRTKSDDEG